jgi:energy-coupling factor transporter ATP-binding protein EcfA2
MKLSKVKISNILGIEDYTLTPGGFTTISGRNGTGKTSILEAIKGALQGGAHDATLLRNGAESGEIVLLLDDGRSITKRVTAEGSSVILTNAEGKRASKPATELAKLIDMLSVNPVDFLSAPAKKRLSVLLESMPLEIDGEALAAAAGIPVDIAPGVHGLQVIADVAKKVYDERTGTNRAVREKDATINQLRQAVPDPVAGVIGSEEEIAAQVAAADAAKVAELRRIDKHLEKLTNKAQEEKQARRDKLLADIDALKEAAKADADAIDARMTTNSTKAAAARCQCLVFNAEDVAPLNAALANIRQNREAVAKREQTLATIKQMESELTDLRSDAERQTKALEDIEAFKARLLADLPIPGLEVADGEILVDGVPFDRVNTARQVSIAVGIARLRAGPLGVVCVDRIECLDAESMAELHKQASDAGLQMLVTRVSDEEFTVDTQD